MPPDGQLNQRVYRAAYVTGIDFDKRRITVTASTDQLCPDNMIILASAWERDYADWLATNPVVTKVHDHQDWVVGGVVDGRVIDYRLYEVIEFNDEPLHTEAIVGWSVYSKGYQRAVSVAWDTLAGEGNLTAALALEKYRAQMSPMLVGQLEEATRTAPDRKMMVITRAKKMATGLVPVPADDKAVVVHQAPSEFFGREATPEMVTAAEEHWGVQFRECQGLCKALASENDHSGDDGAPSDEDKQEKAAKEFEERFYPVTIKSDGTCWGTRITDSNGDRIDGVTELSFTVRADRDDASGHVIAHLVQPELEMKAWAERVHKRIGKVLSAKNKAVIEEAITGAKQAVAALEAVLAAAEGGTEEQSHETESDADREADVELRQRVKRIYTGA